MATVKPFGGSLLCSFHISKTGVVWEPGLGAIREYWHHVPCEGIDFEIYRAVTGQVSFKTKKRL